MEACWQTCSSQRWKRTSIHKSSCNSLTSCLPPDFADHHGPRHWIVLSILACSIGQTYQPVGYWHFRTLSRNCRNWTEIFQKIGTGTVVADVAAIRFDAVSLSFQPQVEHYCLPNVHALFAAFGFLQVAIRLPN